MNINTKDSQLIVNELSMSQESTTLFDLSSQSSFIEQSVPQLEQIECNNDVNISSSQLHTAKLEVTESLIDPNIPLDTNSEPKVSEESENIPTVLESIESLLQFDGCVNSRDINHQEARQRLSLLVLNHLFKYSFGKSQVIDESFLADVLVIMPAYHDILEIKCLKDLSIEDGRQVACQVLGEKEKITTKRMRSLPQDDRIQLENDSLKRLFHDAVFVLLFCIKKREELNLSFVSVEIFTNLYPDISKHMKLDDLNTITCFRNLLVACMKLIPAFNNKGYLLDLVTRLCEGFHKKYITGTGATMPTKHRIQIYAAEGKVKVAKRPRRKKSNSNGHIQPTVDEEAVEVLASFSQTSQIDLNAYSVIESTSNSQNWNQGIERIRGNTLPYRIHSLEYEHKS